MPGSTGEADRGWTRTHNMPVGEGDWLGLCPGPGAVDDALTSGLGVGVPGWLTPGLGLAVTAGRTSQGLTGAGAGLAPMRNTPATHVARAARRL